MGFSLGPPPYRHPPSLVVSYLGRPAGKAFTTTAGQPGLAGLIPAGDTPSRFIPNISPWKGSSSSGAVFFLSATSVLTCKRLKSLKHSKVESKRLSA